MTKKLHLVYLDDCLFPIGDTSRRDLRGLVQKYVTIMTNVGCEVSEAQNINCFIDILSQARKTDGVIDGLVIDLKLPRDSNDGTNPSLFTKHQKNILYVEAGAQLLQILHSDELRKKREQTEDSWLNFYSKTPCVLLTTSEDGEKVLNKFGLKDHVKLIYKDGSKVEEELTNWLNNTY